MTYKACIPSPVIANITKRLVFLNSTLMLCK